MAVADVILLGGLAAIALWQRHIILYVAAFVGLILYGLEVADSDLLTGIPLCIFAGYFLYLTTASFFRRT